VYKTIFPDTPEGVQTGNKIQELGMVRDVFDPNFGQQRFRYVVNRSGGTLTVDSLVSFEGLIPVAAVAAAAGSSKTAAIRAADSFITDGVKVGSLMQVIDDVGAAGAAPEGEYALVTRVQALRVDFLPELTISLGVGDTVQFLRPWHIKASAAKDLRGAVVGVLQSELADGYAGWAQTRGLKVCKVVAAGTAIAAGAALFAGSGILTPTPNSAAGDYDTATFVFADILSDNEGVIAHAPTGIATDQVNRKALVFLACE